MRLAELLGISLGVQNVATNILFFALEFWFGRKYIGLGTFVFYTPPAFSGSIP